LKDYWSDLTQLEDGKNHYIGVLTLEETPEESLKKWVDDHWIIESKSFTPFHVVDGQQRLTTTIILIQCVCEMAVKLNGSEAVLNFTAIDEIKKKFIYDSKDGGHSRSYLFGYESDNPSYSFLKAKIFNESVMESSTLEETIYTQNLTNAKEYFLNLLESLKIEELEVIFKKITQNFLFAVYSMSDDIDVYITFETMNNRGKPLSHLELLKNRLIYLSTKFDSDEYERQELRKTINICWRAIYHQLGRNKKKPLDDDLFLYNHFILYLGSELAESGDNSISQIRRGYKHNFKEFLLEEKYTSKSILEGGLTLMDVHKYVTSLKTSVETWYDLLNPHTSNFSDEIKYWLDKMNRQSTSSYLSLILTFFKECTQESERVSLLKAMERHSFILSLIVNHHFADDRLFIDYAFAIGTEESPSSVSKSINNKTDELLAAPHIYNMIKERMKGANGFYGWHGIRYFLYEYELYLQKQSKTYRDKLNWEDFNQDMRDYATVEHIYPQNTRAKCWTEKFQQFTTKQRKAFRNSLGNLVPLSRPKNSSLSNKSFNDKKSNSKNTVGFRYGCLSENEVAEYDDWGPDEILERGLILVNFMEERWNMEITNRKSYLNLDFKRKKQVRRQKNKKK